MFSGYVAKNIGSLGTTALGFEELNALDFFLPITTRFSNVYIRPQAHAPNSSRGLLMTGGNAMTYINMLEMPSGFNTWQINEFLSAKAVFCVDATTWNSVYLKFSLKQTHGGTLYSMYLGGAVADYTVASNLRLLANGTQIGGTYNPITPSSDPFATKLINLNNYKGTDFELTFETRNICKDTIMTLDNAYIDNVRFFPGPLAVDDSATVKTDTIVTVDMLNNDNNHGISGFKFNLLTMPQHGTVQVNLSDTTITYTPNIANYQGIDSLTYRICYSSDTAVCDEATIKFNIIQSPYAIDDTVFVKMDSTVNVDILANDFNFGVSPLDVFLASNPGHGVAIINSDSTINYTPNSSYYGNDDLIYRISFSSAPLINSNANVHFMVYRNPLALEDTLSVKNDTLVRIPVLTNDNNFGFSTLNTAIIDNPNHGTAVLNADTITYVPEFTYVGNDTLYYQVCYSALPSVCDQAVVVIRVLDSQGINEISANERINIYPNPVKSLLTIDYSSLNINKANITITDLVGKVVMTADEIYNYGFNRRVYNLEKEPSGIYFVNIKTATQIKVFKITKQ
jgi:hypothetical protein